MGKVALRYCHIFFSPNALTEPIRLLLVDALRIGIAIENSAGDGARHFRLWVQTPVFVEVLDPLGVPAVGAGLLAVVVEYVNEFVVF